LDALLDEIHRVLKDGGVLLFTAPFIWGEHEQPYDYARYTQFAWADLLTRHGFETVERVKTTGDIETIFQLLANYMHQGVLPQNRIMRLLLTPFLVAPISLIGFLLARILPDTGTLYTNNIVTARKAPSTD
jgi:SAM-dependent methyltransferase